MATMVVAPAGASAAAGDLTYVNCLSGDTAVGPTGTNACALIESANAGGANSGADLPISVVVSPEGNSVYALSPTDDAILRFSRDTSTGALTYQSCVTAEAGSGQSCQQIPGASGGATNSGMDFFQGGEIAVSPDGKSLYASSTLDAAVTTFARNPVSGVLSHRGCISGSSATAANCAQLASATGDGKGSGLGQANTIAVSPDDEQVYVVTLFDHSVVWFNRDTTTGNLTYADCLTGESDLPVCAKTPGATTIGFNSGLLGLNAMAFNTNDDGESLYLTAGNDSAVTHLDRDVATGALSWGGCVAGGVETTVCTPAPGATSTSAVHSSGLQLARGVVVSPDGNYVYATSPRDDSIVTFTRAAGGGITYSACITGDTNTVAPCVATPTATGGTPGITDGAASGLDGALSPVVSSDGISVYVAASPDDAVAKFDRTPATGALAWDGCLTRKTGTVGCTAVPPTTVSGTASGWDNLFDIDLSPDGRSLYAVGGLDDSVIRFNRELAATPPPGGGGGGSNTSPAPGPTGQRAAALKKCKKKKGRARAKCRKKAKRLPV